MSPVSYEHVYTCTTIQVLIWGDHPGGSWWDVIAHRLYKKTQTCHWLTVSYPCVIENAEEIWYGTTKSFIYFSSMRHMLGWRMCSKWYWINHQISTIFLFWVRCLCKNLAYSQQYGVVLNPDSFIICAKSRNENYSSIFKVSKHFTKSWSTPRYQSEYESIKSPSYPIYGLCPIFKQPDIELNSGGIWLTSLWWTSP